LLPAIRRRASPKSKRPRPKLVQFTGATEKRSRRAGHADRTHEAGGVALAFRISGRVLENDRKLGDRLIRQVVARLNRKTRQCLREQRPILCRRGAADTGAQSFRAPDAAQPGLDYARQSRSAKQAQQTAQSQVDAAEATESRARQ
jgi:hypothetical protein